MDTVDGSMESADRQEMFVRLLARHQAGLRRYVLILLADPTSVDDVLQETSVAIWRKFEEYQADQPFLPWACKFAYFEVLKHRRKQTTQRRMFSDTVIEALAEESVPREDRLASERAALAGCLDQLPASDRELVGLRYATAATVATLARETGQSAKALYRDLERIRRLLADCVRRKVALDGGGIL